MLFYFIPIQVAMFKAANGGSQMLIFWVSVIF
jgi:hypothetical protein